MVHVGWPGQSYDKKPAEAKQYTNLRLEIMSVPLANVSL
jgi:hypothetical protein